MSAGAGRVTAVVAALLAVAALGGAVRAAQETPADSSDAELVEQLVAIEDRAAGVSLFPQVAVSTEETWGTLSGDFVGARVAIDQLDDDLLALVAAASDASGPIADAVEAVASSYRTMLEGYESLEAYTRAGLVGAEPDDETGQEDDLPVGIDEARGHAEVGLTLLLEALAGFHGGYGVLRDAEAAADVRSLFELRFEEVQTVARTDGDAARVALSRPSTQLLVAVDRFEAVGTGDPARTVRYVCLDREDYLELRSAGPVEEIPVPEGEREDLPFPDCPDLSSDSLVVEAPPAG